MDKKLICDSLAQVIRERFNLKKTLHLNFSGFNIFNSFQNNSDTIDYIINSTEILDNKKDKFDFIIGDLPFGMKPKRWENEKIKLSIKEKENWIILFKSLFLLNEEGFGLYTVESNIINRKDFIKQLNRFGFYVNAIFSFPKGTFYPQTFIDGSILLISKKQKESIFVVELNENNIIEDIVNRFIQEAKGDNFSQGLWFMFDKFRGIKETKLFEKVKKLLEQYKTFKLYSIKNISKDIIIGDEIKQKKNSIYIPRNGKIVQKKCNDVKSNNCYQIILNPKYAIADYLCLFFNTDVGRSMLELIEFGNIIPNKKKQDMMELKIPLPELKIQKEIIDLNEKLIGLDNKISEFEKEIALNPLSCQKIKTDVDNILNSLNSLSESDKILSLIREGESKNLEFKSTLRKSIENSDIPDSVIEKSTLKNLAGFMNSEGGILLVGVNDNGKILGLRHDNFTSNDDILKHIKNLIKRDFGPEFYDLINYNIVSIDDKQVLQFECRASKKPVLLGKEEEFYVRTNPATDKLSGKKMLEYINNHFGGVK